MLRTLEHLNQDLGCLQELPGHSKNEVLELVGDARAEAERPKPNVLRLRTTLLALATSIQTAASLQPAYQAITAGGVRHLYIYIGFGTGSSIV